MSIEAMKLALEAIEDLRGYRPDIDKAIETLRTALSQQPATADPAVSRNPFASRCYTMSESHLSGHRLIVGFEKPGDAQDAHEWVARQGRGDFTHQAPSVPGDDFDLICNAIDKADTITMEGDYMLDSGDCIAVVRVMQVLLSVRAAMLAAK